MTPLKLNQTVYHFIHGWEGKVVELLPQEDAPCCIESGIGRKWFMMDGKMFPEDPNPTWVAEPPKRYNGRCCLCILEI